MKKETKLELLNNEKNGWIGIGVFIFYIFYLNFNTLPLLLIGIDISNLSLTTRIIYSLGIEFLFMYALFLIYKKVYIFDFKKFFTNFKQNFKEYMPYWAGAFGTMIVANFIIISLFPNSVATNQEGIDAVFASAPIYMIISAVLVAPIVEETIFRLGIHNIFKNNKLFILISGFSFGLLHVVGTFENLIDLIYIIPYSIPGLFFAYTYTKSKNIFVPIWLHFFHNGFTMLLQCILLLLV